MGFQFATSANLVDTALLPGPFDSASGCSVGIGDGPFGINTIHTDLGGSVFLGGISLPHTGGLVLGFGLTPAVPGIYAKISPLSSPIVLQINSDGSFSLINGSNFLMTNAGLIQFGSRSYFEIFIQKLGVNPAGCSMSLNGNRKAIGNLLGVSAVPDPLTQIELGITPNAIFDSIYLFDTTGTVNNKPIGAKIVGLQASSASGQFNDWTPNGATTLWQAVANRIPSQGIRFATSTASGSMAVRVSSDLQFVEVDALSVVADAKSDSGGILGVGCGDGSTIVLGKVVDPGTVYGQILVPFNINPITGNPWTVSDLATLQAVLQNQTPAPTPTGSFLANGNGGGSGPGILLSGSGSAFVDMSTGAVFIATEDGGVYQTDAAWTLNNNAQFTSSDFSSWNAEDDSVTLITNGAVVTLSDDGNFNMENDGSSCTVDGGVLTLGGEADILVGTAFAPQAGQTLIVRGTLIVSGGDFPDLVVGPTVDGALAGGTVLVETGATFNIIDGALRVWSGTLSFLTGTTTLNKPNAQIDSHSGAHYAEFDAVPTGLSVAFTGSAYMDGSGGSIVSWSWAFGDTGTSTLQSPTHVYSGGGTYQVILTTTDADGNTSACKIPVTV